MCEPTKTAQTLTVGSTVLKFRSLNVAEGGNVLNGDKRANIEFLIRDVETEKTFLIKTDSAGLFCTNKFIPGNTYEIVNFSFNKNFSSGNWAFNDAPLNIIPDTYIEEGYVNPWIDIVIEVWPSETGKGVRYNYKWNYYTLNEVADDFRAKYPKSKWLNYPFAETPEYSDD